MGYLQCGPHPCTPLAAIRDWNSFHPLPTANTTGCHMECTICMECTAFEQHSIAIDSHENVMEQLSTSLNSVAQPFAALQSFCRALRMSRVHVRKKSFAARTATAPRIQIRPCADVVSCTGLCSRSWRRLERNNKNIDSI